MGVKFVVTRFSGLRICSDAAVAGLGLELTR